jgi:sialate O-acetylesterase
MSHLENQIAVVTGARRSIGRAIFVLLSLAIATAQAEVKPNGLFCDGAVLQQGIRVPVWGNARDGDKVTVKFQGQEVSTVARDGRWLVKLKPLKAGGPFTLTIVGDNTITFTNVLVGEVWLCSGQSNMGFALAGTENAAEAIAAAGDPQLRLFTVPREPAEAPQTDVAGTWQESTPETAAKFSAVAYFFGRDLRRARQVPVGLINSSVGGTPAEAWTSRAALAANSGLKELLEPPRPDGVPSKSKRPKSPGCLYNGMIAPLQPFALAGAIWYQGEANSWRAAQYQKLFPVMICNWREAWGQGNFPFLFVQIAPHEKMSPEIREAQLLTWKKVPDTALIVTADVGDAKDIHPKKKEPVGARLALAARAVAYGEKIEYSGPTFASLKVKGNRAILSFTHAGSGLMAKEGELKGFTLAGADGNFVPANAKIEGNKVVISSPSVSKPVAVRYGWDNVPDVNLFNREGLPASPFRTDQK